MDIANGANPEPSDELSHKLDGEEQSGESALTEKIEPLPDRQETPGVLQHNESARENAETLVGQDQSAPPAEQTELPGSLEDDEPVSAGTGAPAVPDDIERTDDETDIPGSSQPVDSLAGSAAALQATENTVLLAREPDPSGGNGVARKKSRYSPWLQIVGIILLICLVGGIVLAVRQPGSASGSGKKVYHTPTPVLPLKITAWCPTGSATVDPQLGKVDLLKVVALAPNDAWLLGDTSNDQTRQTFPLLEHWNGATWSIVPTADTSALLKQLLDQTSGGKASERVSLNDMAVLSDQDIWAVGSASVAKATSSSQGSTIALENQSGKPLIEHWDGRTWQIVASPSGFTGNSPMPVMATNALTHISAVSANDIWAVGTQASKTKQTVTVNGQTVTLTLSGASAPLVEHWNGISWTEKKLPDSLLKSTFLTLDNIEAFSSDDVWSFGTSVELGFAAYQRGSDGQPVSSPGIAKPLSGNFLSYLLHWDGQGWKQVKLPDKNTILGNVRIISDTDIWLITDNGMLEGKTASQLNVVYHWDGTTWSKVADVNSADPESRLSSFSVIAPDNLWLLGHTGKNQPLMEHWDGKVWSLVSPTTPAYGSVQSMAVAGHRAWAIVNVYDAKSAQKTASDTFVTPTGAMLETNC